MQVRELTVGQRVALAETAQLAGRGASARTVRERLQTARRPNLEPTNPKQISERIEET